MPCFMGNMVFEIFFLFLIFLATFTHGQLSATGSFFQQMKGNEDMPVNQHRLIIKPEIFSCDRSNDCHYVGRKSEEKTEIFYSADATMHRNFDEVWKKFLPYKGWISYFNMISLARYQNKFDWKNE